MRARRATHGIGHAPVLLVEAGEDDRRMWLRIPTGVAKIVAGERALWRFHTESEPGLGVRQLFFPRGRVLDALRSKGVKHFDVPATPARIWRALTEK